MANPDAWFESSSVGAIYVDRAQILPIPSQVARNPSGIAPTEMADLAPEDDLRRIELIARELCLAFGCDPDRLAFRGEIERGPLTGLVFVPPGVPLWHFFREPVREAVKAGL